jgi:hypothetical protein
MENYLIDGFQVLHCADRHWELSSHHSSLLHVVLQSLSLHALLLILLASDPRVAEEVD